MTVARFGSFSTGVVVIYLTWYFVSRFTEYSAVTLSSVLVLLTGAGIAALISQFADDRSTFAWYPIGLFAGSILWVAVRLLIVAPAEAPPGNPPPVSASPTPTPQPVATTTPTPTP